MAYGASLWLLIASMGMMAGGQGQFLSSSQSPEADIAWWTNEMLIELERASCCRRFTNGEGGLVQMSVANLGTTKRGGNGGGARGGADNRAGIVVDVTADKRDVRMRDFVRAWRREVHRLLAWNVLRSVRHLVVLLAGRLMFALWVMTSISSNQQQQK